MARASLPPSCKPMDGNAAWIYDAQFARDDGNRADRIEEPSGRIRQQQCVREFFPSCKPMQVNGAGALTCQDRSRMQSSGSKGKA